MYESLTLPSKHVGQHAVRLLTHKRTPKVSNVG